MGHDGLSSLRARLPRARSDATWPRSTPWPPSAPGARVTRTASTGGGRPHSEPARVRRVDSSPARSRLRRSSRAPRAPPAPAHHRPSGGFGNPWPSAPARRPKGSLLGGGRRPPDELLATMLLLCARPDFGRAAGVAAADPRAVVAHWIGHSTFVLHLHGLVVVTDPVWAARLGPLGPRRLVPPPCEVAELPAVVDVVLMSGAAYEHFDKRVVTRLAPRVLRWVVPLGVKALVAACGAPEDRVTELDWWQDVSVPLRRGDGGAAVRIVCTPAQATSPRTDTLWCSFYLLHPQRRVFFCGATGYRAVARAADDPPTFHERARSADAFCPAFREIRERLGPCDVALLPMGNAAPRAQAAAYNLDPVDMLLVHRDLRARRTIAHHWGTFYAPEEGMLDPVRALENALVNCPVSEHDITYLKHGHMHKV